MRARHGGLSVAALVSGRCPRCRQGPIFGPFFSAQALSMHQRCSVCGLEFERESGYFLGAMYISYGLGILTILPVAMALIFVAGTSLALTLVLAVLQTLLTMLFMYRYSRIAWLHLDQLIDPR
jgi:uncharacterized protein (DUF983 family)